MAQFHRDASCTTPQESMNYLLKSLHAGGTEQTQRRWAGGHTTHTHRSTGCRPDSDGRGRQVAAPSLEWGLRSATPTTHHAAVDAITTSVQKQIHVSGTHHTIAYAPVRWLALMSRCASAESLQISVGIGPEQPHHIYYYIHIHHSQARRVSPAGRPLHQ